jgi:hypothetical protein
MMTMKMKVMMLRRVSRKQFHSSPKWSREDNEEKEGQLLKHEDKQTGSTTAKFLHLDLIKECKWSYCKEI